MSAEHRDTEEAIAEFKALMADPAARAAFVEMKAAKEQEGVRMRYEHVLRAVAETPWAIMPSYLGLIVDLLTFRAIGGRLDAEAIAARLPTRRPQTSNQPGGVAVVPLHGVIVPKAGLLEDVSGATSVESFRSHLYAALAEPSVRSIVIDVDSPGGMVDHVPEIAADLRAARARKPITAVANAQAASAAYWLASQAGELVVTPSGRVGSIGVVTAHEDLSAQAEQRGVRTTLISAGRYKSEANPFEPLSEEARAHVQSMVDDYYGMFVDDVAKGRQVPADEVRRGYGQGRVVNAKTAVAEGMADRVGTLAEVLAEHVAAAARRGRSDAPAAARADTDYAATAAADVIQQNFTAIETEMDEFAAAVDDSEWDGNAAMAACDSASCYRAICAGRREGDPSERQTWALPHHKTPSSGPNAAGVRNALARLPQTQGLVNRDQARSHLEAHMREVNPERAEADEMAHIRADLDRLEVSELSDAVARLGARLTSGDDEDKQPDEQRAEDEELVRIRAELAGLSE